MYISSTLLCVACVYSKFGKIHAVKVFREITEKNGARVELADAIQEIDKRFPKGVESANEILKEKEKQINNPSPKLSLSEVNW